MVDHVSLGVIDLQRSRRFYDAALRPLGLVRTLDFESRGSDYGAAPGQLGVEFTITLEPDVPPARGMHVCFRAPDRTIIRTTTRRSFSIPMGTASKRSATRPSGRPSPEIG